MKLNVTASERRSWLLVAPALLWIGLFFVLPTAYLLIQNVLIDRAQTGRLLLQYAVDPFYREILFNSVLLGCATAGGALLIAYPVAFFLARLKPLPQKLLMLATFLPLTLSAVIKTFGWMIVLRRNGPINTFLVETGLVEAPLQLMFTQFGLIFGMINVFLPFMLIPLYGAFKAMDPNYYRAALCLGAHPITAFTRVVLPLSLPAVRAGATVVFALSIGAYVTPTLLIGDNYPTLPMVIARGYLHVRNETAAGVAALLLIVITVPVLLLASERGRKK